MQALIAVPNGGIFLSPSYLVQHFYLADSVAQRALLLVMDTNLTA